MTKSAPVAHAVQTFEIWLKELKEKAELADEAAAYSVLRTVLHQLRDRLTLEEAVDLGAQMPLVVRGLFFEGWQPHKVPRKIRTKEKFLDDITKDILPFTYPIDWAVKTVFALLAHHCDPGEIADVIDQLPGELKELWPENARSFRPHPAPVPGAAKRKTPVAKAPARHHTPHDDPEAGTPGTGRGRVPRVPRQRKSNRQEDRQADQRSMRTLRRDGHYRRGDWLGGEQLTRHLSKKTWSAMSLASPIVGTPTSGNGIKCRTMRPQFPMPHRKSNFRRRSR